MQKLCIIYLVKDFRCSIVVGDLSDTCCKTRRTFLLKKMIWPPSLNHCFNLYYIGYDVSKKSFVIYF